MRVIIVNRIDLVIQIVPIASSTEVLTCMVSVKWILSIFLLVVIIVLSRLLPHLPKLHHTVLCLFLCFDHEEDDGEAEGDEADDTNGYACNCASTYFAN